MRSQRRAPTFGRDQRGETWREQKEEVKKEETANLNNARGPDFAPFFTLRAKSRLGRLILRLKAH